MTSLNDGLAIALIGIGATALLDLWVVLLARLGIAGLNFAHLGRWVAHLPRGRVRHASIAQSRPVMGETALGWIVHYAVGIGFAALPVAVLGREWLRQPSLLPALAIGVATVLAPFCVMQPAMGAGFAASRTPVPWKSRLRSVVNHAVFGLGLYLCALAASPLQRAA